MKSSRIIAVVALSFAALGYAQQDVHAAHHEQAAVATVDGEVRKIDREQSKITLKHGPIANLEMPGMTMVFRVSDPKMLEVLKEGDKVKFVADKINGAYTVTAMEIVK